MRPGSSTNQMSLISVFGAALHMSSFRRTSATLFNPTGRLVIFLAIYLGTRAGSSTIPLQGSTSSLNGLNSMNAPFLDLASTLQHHQLISQLQNLLLLHLTQLLIRYLIWGGMMCWNYHLVILLTTRAASTS